MKKTLNFTTMPVAPVDAFVPLLDEFEAQTGIPVQLNVVEWDKERTEVVNIALRREEGDVLLVGTPVTSDLIGMNALRPFTAQELAILGGQSAFLPSRWQSSIRPGSSQVWAIPWMLDVRVIYYWRDMLEQAGVDVASAFIDQPHLAAALARVQEACAEAPWVVSCERYHILHAVSSWIWARGGDLFSPDGRSITFHEKPALAGARDYFHLLRFMPGWMKNYDETAQFLQRKVAVTIGNAWAINLEHSSAQPHADLLGCVPVPGGSYVGGTDLMIWAHSRNEEAAFALVRFLSQPSVQARLGQPEGQLPVRVSELTNLDLNQTPIRSALAAAALSGRTFPCVSMIGMVEDKLSTALSLIQHRLLDDPEADVDTLLQSFLIPLGKRMNLAFH